MNLSSARFWPAFALTMVAGLSTGIGSFIAFFAKKTNKKFLAFSLSFSAGVMIYVSMVEIFAKAQESLVHELGKNKGNIVNLLAFFGGMFVIAIIDKLIPEEQNPHELKTMESYESKQQHEEEKLMRTGIFTALAISIHNFPEGLATFVSALRDPVMALPIVVAIAIHNIPEGIAVSVPIYYSTGSKKKAFIYSFLSGLTEPLGALLGYLVLLPIMSEVVYGILFSSVAGIMVYISFDELIPAAHEYADHHTSIYGIVLGMMVMGVSIILLS